MTKDTGGPAFPEAFYPTPHSSEPAYRNGMTLRDYAAIKALPAIIIASAEEQKYEDNAAAAYAQADAMIAERNKP